MRIPLALGSAALVLFTQSLAFAQAVPREGAVTLAIERAFSIHTLHTDIENEPDRDLTAFGLLWVRSESAFHLPRAAIDVFVTDGLSVGGSLAYYAWSGDTDRSGFLLAPRVGYAFGLGRVVTFWPRGGLTFYSEEAPGGNPDYDQLALTFEAMFAFWPRHGFGILAGPTLDLGVTGEVDDRDFEQRSIGLSFGLLGVL